MGQVVHAELARVSASHLREFGLKKWYRVGQPLLNLSHFSDWHLSGGTAQSHGWRCCTTCPTCTTSKTEGMKMAKRDCKGKG